MSSAGYYYPVVGRKGTGGVFDRLSIETMQKDHPHQFSLFILAFLAIQQHPSAPQVVKEPAATYMEIASIHGKPYHEWPGDRSKDTSADYSATDKKDTNPVPSRFGGYCNHGAVVFPTWHRPYVMLVEQSIGNIAELLAHDIEANNPGENGVWVKAAKELRFPYWDWAAPGVAENGLPPVLYKNTVEVVTAGGKKQTVDNPLAFFTFVGGIPPDFTDETDDTTGQTAYFSKWTRTYRYAASSPNPPDSNIEALQTKFKAGANDLRRRVAHLFTFNDDEDTATTWDDFSNHTAESKRDMDFVNRGSIEGIHDTVHDLIGGNGQMNNPDYAGFDPIFFLHHTNVDRLLALWEWCYTEYWMGEGYTHDGESYPWTQARGTYAQVYNEQLHPAGPLQPFRTEDGQYWTSDQARFLGGQSYPKYYSFPEFQGVKVDQPAGSLQERVEARKRIQAYYDFDPQTKAKQVPKLSWRHMAVPSQNHPGVPKTHNVIPNFRTFIVHVKLPEHAYNRSYSFQLIHKGNPHSSAQVVGTITVFTRPDHSPCKACAKRRAAGSVIRGMIPIPTELIHSVIKTHGGAELGISFAQTIAHIKKEFTGRLVDANGSGLAQAEGGLEAEQVSKDKAASRRVTPVEISLVSTAVAEHESKQNHPVYLFDWQHHEGIFNAGWLATHRDSV